MNPLENVHPLIAMAETMPLDGYATGTAHDALMREADREWEKAAGNSRARMIAVSAMQLAEYILAKRIAGVSIFPIPAGGKNLTVRAKEFRVRKTI